MKRLSIVFAKYLGAFPLHVHRRRVMTNGLLVIGCRFAHPGYRRFMIRVESQYFTQFEYSGATL
jgi:hypothetical protein